MRNVIQMMCLATIVAALGTGASADDFGTGGNAFTIEFVPISSATNPAAGYGIVTNDYRMGVHEITNDQWDKFKASLGVPVTGDPLNAYDEVPSAAAPWNNPSTSTTELSWYEAAQMVNWLNTSTGHHAAYKFTGTQGTSDYTFATWDAADAAGETNLYRHKDAFYYLPTEDEWVKAAYWNGTNIQSLATKAGESLTQGDGTSGTGWNYLISGVGYATTPYGPWDVGSGSEELNDTFDMMGNLFEWMENPWSDPNYGAGSFRVQRGGSFWRDGNTLMSSYRRTGLPGDESFEIGFRVASIPEPCSLGLLALGALALIKRRRG